jgi:hypothetical protein
LRQVAARYLVPQRSVCVHAAPSRATGGKKGEAKADKPREKKKAVATKQPAKKPATKKPAAKPAAKPASAKKPGGAK